MNTDAPTFSDAMRKAYLNARTFYARECIKLTVAVMAHEITREQFRERMDALNVRFGKDREP